MISTLGLLLGRAQLLKQRRGRCTRTKLRRSRLLVQLSTLASLHRLSGALRRRR